MTVHSQLFWRSTIILVGALVVVACRSETDVPTSAKSQSTTHNAAESERPVDFLARARRLFQIGDLESAAQSAYKALVQDPDNADAKLITSEIEAARGNHQASADLAGSIVTPGRTDAEPPSDAIVLFDGSDLSKWHNGENWKVADGVAYTGKGKIICKEEFGDCQIHAEWSAPVPAKGSGQGRGNSGIFMMDRYEIQVLDSYENETYHDGQAGAIYKQTPPAANVMRPPGQWNTYDIFWTAPRFDAHGKLVSPAYVTAVHNGCADSESLRAQRRHAVQPSTDLQGA